MSEEAAAQEGEHDGLGGSMEEYDSEDDEDDGDDDASDAVNRKNYRGPTMFVMTLDSARS